ncbi:MAG: hypothetical protein GWP91_23955, partial [Rhodobacterales bacterium]|nr:hypothetical protein [Rhodobacterales bacterium]
MFARIAVLFCLLVTIIACAGVPNRTVKPRSQVPRAAPADPAKTPDATVDIFVDKHGKFSPKTVNIQKGDTVRWTFEDRVDSVIAIQDGVAEADACNQIAPYRRNQPMGPSIGVPAGIFVMNIDGPGLVAQPVAKPCGRVPPVRVGETQICQVGNEGEIMQSTWDDLGITGVLIRLNWDNVHTGPGQFDWQQLDTAMDSAVASGKQFSVAVKSGKNGIPDWVFTQGGVERVSLQDWGSDSELDCKKPPCCGRKMDLGSPSDPAYKKHYFDMLRAMASHIQENAAWYRALALVKPSGMNLISSEGRLPNRCKAECACNTEIWAKAKHGYTPQALYDYFDEQFAVIEDAFPEKHMSYMLIQAGYPIVRDREHYLRPDGDTAGLPRGAEQTEAILQ